MNTALTKHQLALLRTLADVAEHEGGEIILKNQYHSAAHALMRRGWVSQTDRFPYRPTYQITPAGLAAWKEMQP